MSATKALQKALKTMTAEQKAEHLQQLRDLRSAVRNPMVRASLSERIRMIEQALKESK